MDELPAHSKLGGSSAERWLNCSGSIALLAKLEIPETTDEPEYRILGTAAHHFAAICLTTGADAWETIGEVYPDTEIKADEPMANAIQVYLDAVRPGMATAQTKGVEEHFHRPELHPDYHSTIDEWDVNGDLLTITDYKHGEGIAVDVEGNAQTMYYAYGKLQDFPEIRRIKLRIVQPRGFHPDGPVREHEITAEELCEWAEDELLPAMHRKELDGELDAGPWCRFCPAKLVCPLLTSLFEAAVKADPKKIITLSNESLGRSYQYVQAVKFYLKAMEDEAYRLLNLGKTVPGIKLVAKKANRVWKTEAQGVLHARLGDMIYSAPELKSPAKIEEIGPEAKELVKEWAYSPLTGFTVALEADKRAAVKVQTTEAAFGEAAKALAP